MNNNEKAVIEYVKKNGYKGAEECELYIELSTPIKVGGTYDACQVCLFTDFNTLLIYALDINYNGKFFDWDELHFNTQCAIKKQLNII